MKQEVYIRITDALDELEGLRDQISESENLSYYYGPCSSFRINLRDVLTKAENCIFKAEGVTVDEYNNQVNDAISKGYF